MDYMQNFDANTKEYAKLPQSHIRQNQNGQQIAVAEAQPINNLVNLVSRGTGKSCGSNRTPYPNLVVTRGCSPSSTP